MNFGEVDFEVPTGHQVRQPVDSRRGKCAPGGAEGGTALLFTFVCVIPP